MNIFKLAVLDQDPARLQAMQASIQQIPQLQLSILTDDLSRFMSLLTFAEVNLLLLDEALDQAAIKQIIAATRRRSPKPLYWLRRAVGKQQAKQELQKMGMHHILEAEINFEELLAACQTHFSSSTSYQQIEEMKPNQAQEISHIYRKRSLLSPRESEVLCLLCAEKTNREIADLLHLSARTVEGYRKNIQAKVGARNLAGLVLFAVREGLVSY